MHASSIYFKCNIQTKHSETILSLQYCELSGDENESTKEWMGHFRIKANECKNRGLW